MDRRVGRGQHREARRAARGQRRDDGVRLVRVREARVRRGDEEQRRQAHELVVADAPRLQGAAARALGDDAAHVVAREERRAELVVAAAVVAEDDLEDHAQHLEVAELPVQLRPRVELALAQRVDRRRRQRAERDGQRGHDDAVDRRREDGDLVRAAVDGLVVPRLRQGLERHARKARDLLVGRERQHRRDDGQRLQREVEVARRREQVLRAVGHLLLARRQDAQVDVVDRAVGGSSQRGCARVRVRREAPPRRARGEAPPRRAPEGARGEHDAREAPRHAIVPVSARPGGMNSTRRPCFFLPLQPRRLLGVKNADVSRSP